MYFNSTVLQKKHASAVLKLQQSTIPIFLIGMMGSGKSVMGKILSQVSGRKFIEMDEIIEQREGMTIKEMFALYGEPYFRAKEKELLEEIVKEVQNSPSSIISCGGGLFASSENIAKIASSGISVFLNANSKLIEERLSRDTKRPLINAQQSVAKLLSERIPFYTQANIMVDLQSHELEKNVSKVLEEIYKYLS